MFYIFTQKTSIHRVNYKKKEYICPGGYSLVTNVAAVFFWNTTQAAVAFLLVGMFEYGIFLFYSPSPGLHNKNKNTKQM